MDHRLGCSAMAWTAVSAATQHQPAQQGSIPQGAVALATAVAAGSSAVQETLVLRADGALFVSELLQLLQGGAAAGNMFSMGLKDMLECALNACAADGTAAPAAGDGAWCQSHEGRQW